MLLKEKRIKKEDTSVLQHLEYCRFFREAENTQYRNAPTLSVSYI